VDEGLAVRQIAPAGGAPRPYPLAYWTPLDADSLRIVLGDGASGVELRLRVERPGRGARLRGVATTFHEERRVVRRSEATARRVGDVDRCEAR
jgi:hypothetical protein